jgi:hypothetical protein
MIITSVFVVEWSTITTEFGTERIPATTSHGLGKSFQIPWKNN